MIPPITPLKTASPRFCARYKAQPNMLNKRQMVIMGTTITSGGFLLKGLSYLVFRAHPVIGGTVFVGGILAKTVGFGMLLKSRLMGGKKNSVEAKPVEPPKTIWHKFRHGVGYVAGQGKAAWDYGTARFKYVEEQISHRMDYMGSALYNMWWDRKNAKAIALFHDKIQDIPQSSAKYLEGIKPLAQLVMRDLEAEVNEESNRLKEIAASDEACIFIINHDNSTRDPGLLGLFTALLYQQSAALGKAETCPRPKFIMNAGVVTSHPNTKMRDLLNYMGVVGLHSFPRRREQIVENTLQMRTVVDGLIGDKNHAFLFAPSQPRDATEEKRQFSDVSKMIFSVAERKGRVKVVPVGFARNTAKEDLGSIYVGEPLYFKLENEKKLSQAGGFAEAERPKNSDDPVWIAYETEGQKALLPLLGSTLSGQLQHVRQQAKNQLPESPEMDPAKVSNPIQNMKIGQFTCWLLSMAIGWIFPRNTRL